MNNSNALANAALRYAEKGLPVLPVRPRGKRPLTQLGSKDATTSLDTVRDWWSRWPDANIGIATGQTAGIFVLDVDGEEGIESLAALVREHGALPNTKQTVTGGGGAHYLFKHPGLRIQNVQDGRLGAGLDVRGEGGYIVAPPSIHESGKCYQWDGTDPQGDPIADAPRWLVDLLAKKPERKAPTVARSSGTGKVQAGGRHPAMVSLGGALIHKGASKAVVRNALQSFNENQCDPPKDQLEVDRLADDLCSRYGTDVDLNSILGDCRTTDDWFGHAMVRLHYDSLRYCPLLKSWFHYNGKVWTTYPDTLVYRLAVDTARWIIGEANNRPLDPDVREKLIKAAASRLNVKEASRMVIAATWQPQAWIKPDEFDSDPWLFNVQNGTIDLRTGKLHPPDPKQFHTKISPVVYDPEAEAPRFAKYLREVIPDPELAGYLQRWAGYCLTGVTHEEKFNVWYGIGRNGKGTLQDVLLAIMGDYGSTVQMTTLSVQRDPGGDKPRNDLAVLQGVRLASAHEPNESTRLDEGLVKQLTGGDHITARFNHGRPFEFLPQFKLTLGCNAKPIIKGTDEGIWSRVHVVPFEQFIPPEKRDQGLKAYLREHELPGILKWAVDGCLQWQKGGLNPPSSVSTATQLYRGESDVVAAFVAERCERDPHAETAAKDLLTAYNRWAQESGEGAVTAAKLGRRLTAMRFNRQTQGTVRYTGLRLKDPAQEGMAA